MHLKIIKQLTHKTIMMKKLLPFLMLLACAGTAAAQTVSFSLPVVPCNNDGVLTASVAGLTPPLTVTWRTYGTTGTTIVHTITGTSDALTSYSGGPVDIMVTDGSGYAFNSYSGASPFTYTLSTTPAICPAPGSIAAAVSGGTAPYTYKWFNKSTGSIVATGNPAALVAGNYGVIITDAAGCTYGSRVQQDSMLINYVSYTASVTATSANCTNGTATVSSVGSTAVLPLSYSWSNGGITSSISGLTRGTYNVEITDAVGCKAIRDTFSGATLLNVYVDQTTIINIPGTTTPATCTSHDGAVGLFVTGGTAPYTYSWSNGAVTSAITGLGAGSYNVSVTDANGCIGENSFYVSTATPITVTSSSTPSLCTSPTGNASILATGGTAPYSYLWYSTPAHTSATATGLAAGNYSFKVTDAVGCERTGVVNVPPVNIISNTFTATSPLCTLPNGSVAAAPTGGATPYTYLWNTGATTAGVSSVTAGFYNVRITDAMGCSITKAFNLEAYSLMGAGISAVDATCLFANDGTLTATAFGGTAPYTYSWSNGATTATVTSLATGNYWLNVSDAAGCTAREFAHLNYDATATSCYCTIEGTIYADTNANCMMEIGENGIPHVQVYCSGIGYTYTDAAGHYSFVVPSGTYTITETILPFYPLSSCQLNNITVTAAAATGCIHNIDFANAVIPVHNLRISAATLIPPVPGNISKQQLVVINEGTLTEDSVFTSMKTDGQLFAPTFAPSGIFTGTPYWYTTAAFPTLAPGEKQTFVMNYNVPANIPLATNVTFRDTTAYNAATSAWLADYTPANNVCKHNTTVVGSYDPNFKEVTPKGVGANGIISSLDTVLEYSVHFQNTGTWYAQNIVVLDTLDSDLDWTTLHPVYESAPCKVSLYQAGTLKVAKFTFNNINLPPQIFDDLRSNGMFTYTVKTNPGLAIGTQFRNSASIYFDYNAPVLTNTTVNTIGSNAPILVNNTASAKTASFTVYPNPANSLFYAVLWSENNSTAEMNITDVTGKTLISKTMNLQAGTQTIATNIDQLASGVYFVSVNNNGILQTQKLVVIR
jgi:uncharacterized repeat protein (TIGR01451 family)